MEFEDEQVINPPGKAQLKFGAGWVDVAVTKHMRDAKGRSWNEFKTDTGKVFVLPSSHPLLRCRVNN